MNWEDGVTCVRSSLLINNHDHVSLPTLMNTPTTHNKELCIGDSCTHSCTPPIRSTLREANLTMSLYCVTKGSNTIFTLLVRPLPSLNGTQQQRRRNRGNSRLLLIRSIANRNHRPLVIMPWTSPENLTQIQVQRVPPLLIQKARYAVPQLVSCPGFKKVMYTVQTVELRGPLRKPAFWTQGGSMGGTNQTACGKRQSSM